MAALAFAGFLGGAGIGIPGRLVGAEEEDGTVGVERVLRAIAVVHVPIGDQHFGQAVAMLGVSRGNRHVVEDAEAHALLGSGVVAGRADGAESVGGLTGDYGVQGIEHSAYRTEGDFQGTRAYGGVAGA